MPNQLADWHHAITTRDIAMLDDILADNATFHSPVVYTPQVGKEVTKMYLSAAFHVLLNDSFHYVREVADDKNAILEFMVDVDGVQVNGVDMIRWDHDGKIADFKVMLRPYKAINLVKDKMREMLESL
ncbi:nuclear transport factor 2 family protein [Zhongshania sp.]|uniref:nuclear transport factor 2 family protein n=1 Tax=Zhongshania sp. TaxID=1971902 RepID=UPI001B4C36D9|nr:nuclear transport factor 2 family protein [Zhongshania sp.]MBQ0796781.1 nuclear transport factor 2 family protein [Zhongshania sp.]